MDFSRQETAKALRVLQTEFPNPKGNNKISIGGIPRQMLEGQTYNKLSMKRSKFQNIDYNNCQIENVAFTASSFHHVNYKNTLLNGNSFACCNFFDCIISEDREIEYFGNNFSQSNFTNCKFQGLTLKNSGFLQTLFYNCKFEGTTLQSNTLEGSCFNKCTFEYFHGGNSSVEFIELLNSELKSAEFPFYQYAYIIGAADFLKSSADNILLTIDEKIISCEEYQKQIENLILFYMDKQEFFPACNLLITINMIKDAQSVFLSGINQALETLDFRMIRHFCRLAKRHNLLDEVTVYRARKEIDNCLYNNEIPPERLNDLIVNAGEIHKILLSGRKDSVTYNFNIRTNIRRDDKQGIEYVNSLSKEINNALAQKDWGQLGYQVAVSNHSPFEIIVDVICSAGAIATIAQVIWSIVDKNKEKNASNKSSIPDNYILADTEFYAKYIDDRIELSKERLHNLNNKYSQKTMNHYIDEITQQLKTDIANLYSKDIMIFKKTNTNNT